MRRLTWLSGNDPPDAFPDVALALEEPAGLLAAGGDLSLPRLLAAYRRGIFPWYSQQQPVLWWSPDPRMVLFPSEFRCSRSLARTVRRNVFRIELDRNFPSVIRACAEPRATQAGTWLNPAMISAYERLHLAGFAHSVEAWHGDQLAGGLYGIHMGGVFFGESMFSRQPDASKVALAQLVGQCAARGIQMIDCQIASAHLHSLGAREIRRSEFLQLLQRWVKMTPGAWTQIA